MIKKICLFLLLFLLPITYAQTAINPNEQPTCDQMALFTKITQEHQLTRKFMIDTYNEKSQLFFTEADNRMQYLEDTYRKELHSAVFTLGFLWLFIAILINALFGILNLWLKQRQYKKLKKDIAAETIQQIKAELDKKTQVNMVKDRPSIEITENLPMPPTMPIMKGDNLEDVYEKLKKVS